MEEWNETVEKWQELMEKGHYVQLREELNEENPANVAEFLEELPADIVYRLENRKILIQQGGLVLGEITDHHVMPQRQRPLMLDLFHDTLHQGRLTLAIL